MTLLTPAPAATVYDLNQPTPVPEGDAGLYLVADGAVIVGPEDLVLACKNLLYSKPSLNNGSGRSGDSPLGNRPPRSV